MKHKIAGLLLAAGLLSSLLTGCSKEESAAGSETQAEAAQTVYAYQASYLPLDAGEYEVSYINAMCVSGENLFVTAECRTVPFRRTERCIMLSLREMFCRKLQLPMRR